MHRKARKGGLLGWKIPGRWSGSAPAITPLGNQVYGCLFFGGFPVLYLLLLFPGHPGPLGPAGLPPLLFRQGVADAHPSWFDAVDHWATSLSPRPSMAQNPPPARVYIGIFLPFMQ
jgi:hypothetical protein